MPRHDYLLAVGCVALTFIASPACAGNALNPARKAQLIHLLKHDCGSCHGMTLKGSLGPSLLPETLAGRRSDDLHTIILDGVPDTPMPAWRGQLTESDATFLTWLIQHGIPDGIPNE